MLLERSFEPFWELGVSVNARREDTALLFVRRGFTILSPLSNLLAPRSYIFLLVLTLMSQKLFALTSTLTLPAISCFCCGVRKRGPPKVTLGSFARLFKLCIRFPPSSPSGVLRGLFTHYDIVLRVAEGADPDRAFPSKNTLPTNPQCVCFV